MKRRKKERKRGLARQEQTRRCEFLAEMVGSTILVTGTWWWCVCVQRLLCKQLSCGRHRWQPRRQACREDGGAWRQCLQQRGSHPEAAGAARALCPPRYGMGGVVVGVERSAQHVFGQIKREREREKDREREREREREEERMGTDSTDGQRQANRLTLPTLCAHTRTCE